MSSGGKRINAGAKRKDPHGKLRERVVLYLTESEEIQVRSYVDSIRRHPPLDLTNQRFGAGEAR